VAMITANMAWGLMAPLSKMAMGNPAITSWILVSFRVIGAAIAFWIASLFVENEKVPRRDLLLLAVGSLLGIIMNQGVFILGISYTSPINASIVTTTLPIVVMVLAALFLKEPITWLKFGGILVGGLGALLLILSNPLAHGNMANENNLLGIGLCFLSQFCYGTYFVLFKKTISKYHPVTLMKWMFLFASMIYLPLNFNQLISTDFSAVPSNIFFDIAFVVFGGTFFGYLMIPIGQKNLRPTVATMYNNVQPIVASIATVFLGIGTFGWNKMGSILLAFVGVYMVTKSRARNAA
jgi:drug/metabolite transporter (DMT)-like permease